MTSADAFHCVDYHRLQTQQGETLVYNSETMEVCPLDAGTATVLDVLHGDCGPGAIDPLLRARGIDSKQTDRAIRQLLELGLIVPGEQAEKAAPAQPGSEMAFMVAVAQHCNLTCSYCYVHEGQFDFGEKPAPVMSKALAGALPQKLQRLFPGFNIYRYHFYGGEPLLNPKAIREITEAAVKEAEASGSYAQFEVTTNGTLVDEALAQFFDKHRFKVYLSIDGDQQRHDKHRRYRNGKGSFAEVEKALELLKQYKGIHLVGSTVVQAGLPLHEALALLSDRGVKQCKVERPHLEASDELALKGEARERYLKDLRALSAHYIQALERGSLPVDSRLTSRIMQLLLKRRREAFCGAGSRMFGVTSEGDLYPCSLHAGRPQMRLGDIEGGTDAGAVENFRSQYSLQGQPKCAKCWAHHLCGGGCSAMVERFGSADCETLRTEAEASIEIYHHFASREPTKLLALASPELAAWAEV